MQYVITKIEWVNNEVKHTPIGYVTSQTDADSINTLHYSDFSAWVDANKSDLENEVVTLNDYLSVNPTPYVYTSKTSCACSTLEEIADINNPEE